MITINKSRFISDTKRLIKQVVKTDCGVFLIKSVLFLDETAQLKVYRVSFDDLGEMICESNGGLTIVDLKFKGKLIDFHIKGTNLINMSDIINL